MAAELAPENCALKEGLQEATAATALARSEGEGSAVGNHGENHRGGQLRDSKLSCRTVAALEVVEALLPMVAWCTSFEANMDSFPDCLGRPVASRFGTSAQEEKREERERACR